MSGLGDQDRDDLLAPCVCGHTLNDHGTVVGCYLCEELDGIECDVRFEALLERGVEAIVTRAVNAALTELVDDALANPTWPRGMYGCPDDMVAARHLRERLRARRT